MVQTEFHTHALEKRMTQLKLEVADVRTLIAQAHQRLTGQNQSHHLLQYLGIAMGTDTNEVRQKEFLNEFLRDATTGTHILQNYLRALRSALQENAGIAQ